MSVTEPIYLENTEGDNDNSNDHNDNPNSAGDNNTKLTTNNNSNDNNNIEYVDISTCGILNTPHIGSTTATTTIINSGRRILPHKRLRPLNMQTDMIPLCAKALKWNHSTTNTPATTPVIQPVILDADDLTKDSVTSKTTIEPQVEKPIQLKVATIASKHTSGKKQRCIKIYSDSEDEDSDDDSKHNSKFYDTIPSPSIGNNKTKTKLQTLHPKKTSWIANEGKHPCIRVGEANSIIGMTEYHQRYKQERDAAANTRNYNDRNGNNHNKNNNNADNEFDVWSNL